MGQTPHDACLISPRTESAGRHPRSHRWTMLTRTFLLQTPDVAIWDVRCSAAHRGWSSPEQETAHTIVFVREGCFYRAVNGRKLLADPGVAYLVAPGEEQRVAHPHERGDICTAVRLSPSAFASVAGGEIAPPPLHVFTSPAVDLEHRRLLAAVRQGSDPFACEERVWLLASTLVETVDAPRVASGRPATEGARRQLVHHARERLTLDPSTTLARLARELAVSPHHLSRIFHAFTGETLSRYRSGIQIRYALERLAEGERSLTRLAAELGFADHAHLSRSVRAATGSSPSALRSLLAERD
jgi:AraC-like DNA-binding protein